MQFTFSILVFIESTLFCCEFLPSFLILDDQGFNF